MAEQDPPAANVDGAARANRRRRARKGRGSKRVVRAAAPEKASADADPSRAGIEEVKVAQADGSHAAPSRSTGAKPREDKTGVRRKRRSRRGRGARGAPAAAASKATAAEVAGAETTQGPAAHRLQEQGGLAGQAPGRRQRRRGGRTRAPVLQETSRETGPAQEGGASDALTIPGQETAKDGAKTARRDNGGPQGAPHGDTQGAAPRPRQAYAAIDLGTNNCRLLIARPSGENFTVIDAFSRVVRLGEGLAQTGQLSQAAMDRTLAALKVCADKLMRRNVYLARSVATEACRRATNGREFIERVRTETGIALDIISAREEARLAVLGCHVLLEEGMGPAMIFDIGGGSTELVLIESTGTVPRILDWQSVPWGVVSLTESCEGEGATHEDRARRYARMRALVAESFADFTRRIAPAREAAAGQGPLRLLGTSGTVTTLASLHLELAQYDRRMVDGLIVPAESMRAICARLSTMPIEQRRELNCIGRERADLVVAGCAILDTILDLWPAARLGVADRGIREGILRSLMAAHAPGSESALAPEPPTLPARAHAPAPSRSKEASAPMSKP